MLKKLLYWIVCFGLSVLFAAAGVFSGIQGEIFFVMHMIIYGILVIILIMGIYVQESDIEREEDIKALIVLIVSIVMELAVTWVITFFGVNFYTAYMIFTLIGCFF